jgi:hypothetical protein
MNGLSHAEGVLQEAGILDVTRPRSDGACSKAQADPLTLWERGETRRERKRHKRQRKREGRREWDVAVRVGPKRHDTPFGALLVREGCRAAPNQGAGKILRLRSRPRYAPQCRPRILPSGAEPAF